jgi:crotonobetaine/carnitine-CoA ligase
VIARLVDDEDNEVPTGHPGEFVLRYERPWEGGHGYWRDPEATVRSWRNLWLHTGDVFVADADGNYRFVDRKKDVIRRRGENIAASEVETAAMSHPMVREAAAFGVPSPLGEEDVMVLVVAEMGITAEALHTHLTERLGRHMVPRFVRVQTEALPKTPTGKIVKGPLRTLGANDAWDSERSRE